MRPSTIQIKVMSVFSRYLRDKVPEPCFCMQFHGSSCAPPITLHSAFHGFILDSFAIMCAGCSECARVRATTLCCTFLGFSQAKLMINLWVPLGLHWRPLQLPEFLELIFKLRKLLGAHNQAPGASGSKFSTSRCFREHLFQPPEVLELIFSIWELLGAYIRPPGASGSLTSTPGSSQDQIFNLWLPPGTYIQPLEPGSFQEIIFNLRELPGAYIRPPGASGTVWQPPEPPKASNIPPKS